MWLVLFAAGVLQIVDTSQGCFHQRDGSAPLNETAGGYTDGARVVPKADVRQLRHTLEESEHRQDFDPGSLGITPESVKQSHDLLLKNAREFARNGLPSRIEAHLTFGSIAAFAKRHLDSAGLGSTTHIHVEVRIGDDISVSSDHDVALMVPWHVTMHGRSWDTYSTDVSRAVAAILGPGANRELAANASFWPVKFWTDMMVGMRLASDAESDEGAAQVEKLSGHDAISRRYTILQSSVSGDVLSVTLRSTQPDAFDTILWNVQLAEHPSFNSLLSRLNQLAPQLVQSTWFERWRREGAHRFVTVRFVKQTDARVLAAWHQSGFAGEPDAVVEFNPQGSMSGGRGHLIVGASERRVLVRAAHDLPGTEAAAGRGVLLSAGRTADYLTGDADGNWERHTLANPPPAAAVTPASPPAVSR